MGEKVDVGLGSVQIPLAGRDDCAEIRVVDSGKNIILEINSESDNLNIRLCLKDSEDITQIIDLLESTINYGLY